MIFCKYKCGNEAVKFFKNGEGCCQRRANLCPAQIEKTKIKQHTPDPITGLTPLQRRERTLDTVDPITGLTWRALRTKKMAQTQVTSGDDGLTPRQRAEAKLAQIDPVLGLSLKEIAARKAQATMSQIDSSTGMTRLQLKGEKARQTWLMKPPEEIADINSRRIMSMMQLLDNGLTRYQISAKKGSITKTKVDPETGLSIAQKTAQKNKANHKWHQNITRGKASKESLKLFRLISDQVKHLPIQCIYGHDQGSEWWLRTKSGEIKYYDFTIPELKLIIEYHGERYHPNINKLSHSELDEWRTPFTHKTAQEIIDNDNLKLTTAIDHGFEVIVVWSSDNTTSTVDRIVDKISRVCAERGLYPSSHT